MEEKKPLSTRKIIALLVIIFSIIIASSYIGYCSINDPYDPWKWESCMFEPLILIILSFISIVSGFVLLKKKK